MSTTLTAVEAPTRVVELEIPKRASRSEEPKLSEMVRIVELVRQGIESYGTIKISAPAHRGVYNPRGEEELKEIKVAILKKVALQLQGESSAIYALYVFALFRFGLTMKYLSWMSSWLDLTDQNTRRLCMDAQRHWARQRS